MKNIDKLVEALQNGENMDEVVVRIAADYEAKLRQLVFPMEPWEAPFWIAVLSRMADTIAATVQYSTGAAESMMEILRKADEGK